jgi:uncharacterized membrane protein
MSIVLLIGLIWLVIGTGFWLSGEITKAREEIAALRKELKIKKTP